MISNYVLRRWALNNPHLSLHITPEERITVSSQRKRNGHLKRPPHNVTSILSNLHLLLRVPSFARWPLRLHFFDRDVHSKWNAHCSKPELEPLNNTLEVVTNFAPPTLPAAAAAHRPRQELQTEDHALAVSSSENDGERSDEDGEERDPGMSEPKCGIHALPVDHSPMGQYLEKGHDVTNFEREGSCVVCHQELEHDKGLYAICSKNECEGVGHLDCWSRAFLQQKEEGGDSKVILPMEGQCPKCGGTVKWIDMMRELTLRTRGQKEVEKILKKRRKAAGVIKAKVKVKTKAATKTAPQRRTKG